MSRRMLIGICRGGTTALLQGLTQHPRVDGVYQPIKSGLRANGEPDYRFLTEPPAIDGRVRVAKEALGWGNPRECSYALFPSDGAVAETRPVFLFREPRLTFASWTALSWGDLELFLLAYRSLNSALLAATRVDSGATLVLTHELLVAEPQRTLGRVCDHWGLRLHPSMTAWSRPLLENPRMTRAGPAQAAAGFAALHHAGLASSLGFVAPLARPALPLHIARSIDCELGPIYAQSVRAARPRR